MNEYPNIPFGIWHSACTYESSSRNETFTDERKILIAALRGQMLGMSLHEPPAVLWMQLWMQLSMHGRLMAATWTERTNPDGYYAGAEFHGVAQFILAADSRSMSGAWAGHSRDMSTVNTGPWNLTYVEPWPGDLPPNLTPDEPWDTGNLPAR